MFDKQTVYNRVLSVKLVQRSAHIFKLPRGLEAVGRGLGPNGAPLRGVRALMELQPVKEILQDIKYALRNVHLDRDNNYFEKPVQIRKEGDIVAPPPSTNDYTNNEQQNAQSTSTVNTGQKDAPSNNIADTEQINTLSTSIANIIEQQNSASTSDVVSNPSVLLELAKTLKELVNTLQRNNLVNNDDTPNITQENVAQKRPNSNPIESQTEDSQTANSGPEPAKKPKKKLEQQLPDSSAIFAQHPSTSSEACPRNDNPNVPTYYPHNRRNLAQNFFLPNPNVPFIPNGHNVARFDMIGSILNSNQFRSNILSHNVRQNTIEHIPNRNPNPATSQPNAAEISKKNNGQNSPAHKSNSSVGNVKQKLSADQNMNQIPPNVTQNTPLSSPNRNASNVNRNISNPSPHTDQTKSTSTNTNAQENMGRNTPDGNRSVGQSASNVNRTLHQSTSPSPPQITISSSESGMYVIYLIIK